MMTTYTNTVNQRRTVTDRLVLASPYDIAAIQALGLDNTAKFKFVDTPGVQYTWYEDTYVQSNDTLSENITSAATSISVSTISIYQPGDVIKIDDEYMWVSSTNNSTVLTVTRGFGNTTAATHNSGAEINILYSARREGADADDSPYSEITQNTNYSTIFEYKVQAARSDMRIKRYGMTDIVDYYIDKGMDMLKERLDRLAYYGKKSSNPRSSGGLNEFITTNVVNLSNASLTRKHLDDMLERIYSYGGSPDLILCSTWARRKINSFFESFISTERDERVGGMRIDVLEHPFGGEPINIITDRHCQKDYLYLLDRRYVGYITIDPFFYEPLAKTGDSESGQIIGEYGFVVQFEKAHGILKGFSITS